MNSAVIETSSSPDAPGARCLHCGDRCAAVAVLTDAGSFCCAGCEAVYSIIAANGLQDFYACEIPPGLSQRTEDRRDLIRFSVLDHPNLASRFVVQAGPGRVRATFTVPSLHCASCLWLLERLWKLE